MGAQVKQMATQALNAAGHESTPAQQEIVEQTIDKVMALTLESSKAMLEKTDVIYAEVYSEAELKTILAFFQSAEGKSMILKQPQIMQRMMPLVQGMQQDLMPKIQHIVEEAKAAEAAAATPAATPGTETAAPTPQK